MLPTRIMIGDGVALNVIQTDKFKTNYISVRFLCPLAGETAAQTALLPYVLKRGCERFPTMTDLSRHLELLYGSELKGSVGKLGDTQYIAFSSFPLSDLYTDGEQLTNELLSLIYEVVYRPLTEDGLLKREYVESEKRTLSDRVRAEINDKTSYAVRRCAEEMGRGDPSSVPVTGTLEDIEAVTPELLTARLKEIRDTAEIEIWCVGTFDIGELADTCRSLFGGEGRRPCELKETSLISRADEPRAVTEDLPVKQGKLSLGFTAPDAAVREKLGLYNLFIGVLSSSPTAKLFMNVREKLSLCYYCYGISDKKKGTLIVTSGIETENKEKAERAILKEIEDCKNGLISEEELVSAKKMLVTNAKSIYDDASALSGWYFAQLGEEHPMTPEKMLEDIEDAGPSDIANIARGLTLHTVYFLNGTQKGEDSEEETDE